MNKILVITAFSVLLVAPGYSPNNQMNRLFYVCALMLLMKEKKNETRLTP
jgi:hypothetical protein